LEKTGRHGALFAFWQTGLLTPTLFRMSIQESIPLSYFQDLSEDTRLVEVLETLKSALQSRPAGLDEQIEVLIDHLSSIIRYFNSNAPEFFRKAMSEMDRLNYPPYVRAVVERYNARFQN